MRLAIICGALEPGKDGVGDYTKRLADFCRSLGHSILLCSLNDAWLKTESSRNESELRISNRISWVQRANLLYKALLEFQPDMVSIQFVPYAYHKRGFCSDLISALQPIAKKYRWHIMFHELWLGLNPQDSLKYKLLGWWQKHLILKLVAVLSPKITHTQCAAYADFLARQKIPARRLPLFSNIPVQDSWNHESATALLTCLGVPPTDAVDKKESVFVFFGSLHPEWSPDLLMEKIGETKAVFLSLGRLGARGRAAWDNFSQKFSSIARFADLGELTSKEISNILSSSDIGVAASPWNLIEKSGSVAAMIEHGLPVIVTRNDFLSNQDYQPNADWSEYLHKVWAKDFSITKLTKGKPSTGLANIGHQFLADLNEACL